MMFNKMLIITLVSLMVIPALAQQDTLNKLDTNGKKHGYWLRYQDDTLAYEGRFDHGIPTGLFVYYYPNSAVKSTVMYVDKGKEARTVMYHPNGAMMAIGKYVEQKKDSVWKYYNELEGLVSQEYYVKGTAEGDWVKYNGSGQVIEKVQYKAGKREGEWVQYFDNGKEKLKATYKNDLLDGNFLMYFSNGMFCISGKYEKSLPAGTWIHYTVKGEIERKDTYKDGLRIKSQQLIPVVVPDSEESKKEIEAMRRQLRSLGIE